MIFKRHHFKSRNFLNILKKPLLLPDFPIYTLFHLSDPALHLFGLCANIGSGCNRTVMFPCRIKADFRAFTLFRPLFCLACSLSKLSDGLSVLFILSPGKLVFAPLILLPGAEIAVLDLYGLSVQHQYMID